MGTYIVSDIHGQLKAFEDILKQIEFSVEKDTLYLLGDYIDWGDESIGGIRKIQELQAQDKTGEHIIALKGNHEFMMLNIINNIPLGATMRDIRESGEVYEDLVTWEHNKGLKTLRQYLELNNLDRKNIKNWMNNLQIVVEDVEVNGEHNYLCHSFPIIDPAYTTDEESTWWRVESSYDLTNFRIKFPGYTLISGHTIVDRYNSKDKQGRLKIYNRKEDMNYIDIDCGAKALKTHPNYARLACLRLEDLKEYYSEVV